jgi:hypothetical protein
VTRTPGYWGTHPCQTQQVLDGGVVESCGVVQTNVMLASDGSAIEDNCFGGKDVKGSSARRPGADSNHGGTSPQQVQLIRQCSAASLNIAVSSQAGGSCGGFLTAGGTISAVFAQCCGTFCSDGGACGSAISTSGCIEWLDEFNNSADSLVIPGFGMCNDARFPTVGSPRADSSVCRQANGNGFVSGVGAGRTLGPAQCP